MSTLRIETAAVFEPLLEPARHKAAYGGRGSGKSHFFAEMGIEDALRWPGETGEGLRWLCSREVQKSLKDSAKQLIESKLAKFRLGEADGFRIYTDSIKTPGDGLVVFTGLQDHTSESIKSYEGFHRFFAEEAQSIGSRSIELIKPTIRWESKRLGMTSEMWWAWNPRKKTDPVDVMFRGAEKPTNATVVRANWSDNPFFPKVLEEERQDCLRMFPDRYDHVWEGGYVTALEGAYYAKQLAEARADGRIGVVAKDDILPIKAFFDLGGSGANADAMAIWIVQWVGQNINVLDYIEGQGQVLSYYVTEMRSRGYGNAQIYLPHDGVASNSITGKRYEDHVREAGFTDVRVIPNQGKGAAMMRIEATRRLFPKIWIHEKKCQAGLDALGWYHEKRDPDRGIGLGPDHDWSSHCADAFGLMAICHAEHVGEPARRRARYSDDRQTSGGSWAV